MALREAEAAPQYQRIGEEAVRLRRLGLSYRRIGGRLGVTDKTVRRAAAWQAKRES